MFLFAVRCRPAAVLGLLLALPLSGCKSAFVEAVVRNNTDRPISLIEVDYPSASFGRETLPAHATFQYRFKILGSGATRVQWTDAERHEHTVAGPSLHEGQYGHLDIGIADTTASWTPVLQ